MTGPVTNTNKLTKAPLYRCFGIFVFPRLKNTSLNSCGECNPVDGIPARQTKPIIPGRTAWLFDPQQPQRAGQADSAILRSRNSLIVSNKSFPQRDSLPRR